jgi:hypothetical protein
VTKLDPAWIEKARKNLTALRRAGVTENLLGVGFGEDAGWPSPETLLPEDGAKHMATQFAALGRLAKELGFRGVSIDIEYPYKRYSLDHPIWTYRGYAAGDLTRAAYQQGRRAMAALLDAFPEAVVMVLPGDLYRCRPIGRYYSFGLLHVMAERDAPGGFHLGSEYAYNTADPLSTLATARFDDPAVAVLETKSVAAYWRRRCTIAPGMWPLHMVETGGKDYPMQPWSKEVAELREHIALARGVAKRYLWSYSGNPIWYVHTPEIEARYGLKKQDLKRPDIDIRDWQHLLADKTIPVAPKWQGVIDRVRKFDRGEITPHEICDAFGAPAAWWVLGLLGHPRKLPQFTAAEAVERPIDRNIAYQGRDGAVRWFPIDMLDLRGLVQCQYVFDWRATDNASAHFAAFVHSPARRRAQLAIGWDDVIVVRLGGKVVFDTRQSAQQIRGMLYLDKYRFEKYIPVTLEPGRTRVTITSINYHGVWSFMFRLTDEQGVPFPDVRFGLE